VADLVLAPARIMSAAWQPPWRVADLVLAPARIMSTAWQPPWRVADLVLAPACTMSATSDLVQMRRLFETRRQSRPDGACQRQGQYGRSFASPRAGQIPVELASQDPTVPGP
jgi:hypothetical protein